MTETVLMEDRERAVVVLEELREAGVRIAVDDYGTAYSSLAYFAELPICEFKLVRAFVGNMASSDRNRVIVTSTIDLAHALGVELGAEGVEDGHTLELLTRSGCDLGQGYHISRPLTSDAMNAMLRQPVAPGWAGPAAASAPPAGADAAPGFVADAAPSLELPVKASAS